MFDSLTATRYIERGNTMNELLLTDGSKKDYGTYGRGAAKRAFRRVLGGAALYLVVSIAVIILVQAAMMLVFGTNMALSLLSDPVILFSLQVFAMYIVAFPIFVLCVRRLPSALRRKGSLSFEEFVVLFFISEGAMIFGALASNLITSFLSGALGYDITNATSDLLLGTPIWLVILVAVIIGPIIEELIFRKYFIDKLGVFGDRCAIVVSSVAFGLFHGNLSQLIYATMLGFILGYVYTKTGCVKYTALLHMVINFVGTVPALLLSESYDRLSSIAPDAELNAEESMLMMQDSMNVLGLTFLQYAFAITGVILFIYCTVKRKYRVSSACDIALPKRRLIPTIIFNVGTVFFLLISAYQIYTSLLPAVV